VVVLLIRLSHLQDLILQTVVLVAELETTVVVQEPKVGLVLLVRVFVVVTSVVLTKCLTVVLVVVEQEAKEQTEQALTPQQQAVVELLPALLELQ
jgi:hypothetical protein